MRRGQDLSIKLLISFFLLIGISIGGYWVVQVSEGYFYMGQTAMGGGPYLVWHLIAEFLTAGLAIIAAFSMLSKNPLGFRLGLTACGMLLYTGLNSIGWGIHHDPGMLILFIIGAIGALYGIIVILNRGDL